MLDFFIRGKGTAPKRKFLLMLDPMSNMQTFACSIHVKAKNKCEAQVNWHHLKPTSAGIYSVSALPMPQKCTVTNIPGAYYYYYYYYTSRPPLPSMFL